MPKVLIADALSSLAVETFRRRGVEPTVVSKLSAAELAEMIGEFDGLAVRSATKVTPDLLAKAPKLRVVGRAGIGIDNIDLVFGIVRDGFRVFGGLSFSIVRFFDTSSFVV